MAKTMLAISLLVGAGACSSPAPTAQRSTTTTGPTTTDSTSTTEPTTTTAPEPPTTTSTTAEPVEEAPTTVPTTRARSAPTTTLYVVPTPRSSGATPPDYIAQCESGGDPRAVNPNGHYGKWQFSQSTWESVGGTGRPDHASEAEQDYRASILWAGGSGASHWECA